MNSEMNSFVQFTDFAAQKINDLIRIKGNKDLKLRVYIVGGGCSGFQYCFILDEKINDDDFYVEKDGAILVVDPLSLQYLMGGVVDYYEELLGSRFIVTNPNVKNTCSCGSSFNI